MSIHCPDSSTKGVINKTGVLRNRFVNDYGLYSMSNFALKKPPSLLPNGYRERQIERNLWFGA